MWHTESREGTARSAEDGPLGQPLPFALEGLASRSQSLRAGSLSPPGHLSPSHHPRTYSVTSQPGVPPASLLCGEEVLPCGVTGSGLVDIYSLVLSTLRFPFW